MPGVPPRIAAACRPVSMPSPAASTTASRTDGSPMKRASNPMAFEPPPTRRSRRRAAALRRREAAPRPRRRFRRWRSRTMSGVRVQPHRGAKDVMGGLDVRDPVAHRLVDRVLQRGRPRGDRADLGTERPHPQHVRTLALDVLGAHVDDAWQVEEGAGGRRRDAVLAGAGLGGSGPRLPEPAREQRLAQGVVDLVRARVREVLALEVHGPGARGSARPIGDAPGDVTAASRAASTRTASASRSAR